MKTFLILLLFNFGNVPSTPDTLEIVDRGSAAYPLFRKQPKENQEFYHLIIKMEYKP